MAPHHEPLSGSSHRNQRQSFRRARRPTLPQSNPSQIPLISEGTATSTPLATPIPTRPSSPVDLPAQIYSRPSTPRPSTPTSVCGPKPVASSTVSQTPSKQWTRGDYFWRSFFTICIPLLLSALEGSITNTALPTISNDLGLGTNFTWVATAFLLASTVFQPLYGQLADMYGRKVPMMLAVTVFAAGSAISGWSKGTTSIILGRVVQGFGTGGIDLFAELILSDLVPLRQRGLYMSIKNGFFAVGTAVGPLLGGYFAEHNWRWCFWINMPVCICSFLMMLFWLRLESGEGMKDKDAKKELLSIDYLGVVLLTSSVILLLVALCTGGTSHPWGSEVVIAPLVFGVLVLTIFPFWERSQFCARPIMPPSIFARRTSWAALTLTTIHGFVTYGSQFYLPVFFQAVQRVAPSQSGVLVLPMTLTIVVMATLGGPALSQFGKYRPIHKFSFAIMLVGLGFWLDMNRHTPTIATVFMQFVAAFGIGLVVPTLLPAVQVELEDYQNGAAAGSWAFLRGTGSLFGVAVPGALFNLRFSQLLHTIHPPASREVFMRGQAYQEASHISELVARYGEAFGDQVVAVFTASLKTVWIILIGMAGIGFLITFVERSVKMRKELDTQFGLSPVKGQRSPGDLQEERRLGEVENGSWSKNSDRSRSATPTRGDRQVRSRRNSGCSTLVESDVERGAGAGPGPLQERATSRDETSSGSNSLKEKHPSDTTTTNSSGTDKMLQYHRSTVWRFLPQSMRLGDREYHKKRGWVSPAWLKASGLPSFSPSSSRPPSPPPSIAGFTDVHGEGQKQHGGQHGQQPFLSPRFLQEE